MRISLFVAAVFFPSLLHAATPPSVPGAEYLKNTGKFDEITVGKVLLTELNCVACHSEPVSLRQIGMKGTPDLSQAGGRLAPKWMKAFLLQPNVVRPGTTMPDLLRITDHGRERDVEHLVHFLASLGGPLSPSQVKVTDAMIEAGRATCHRVGCTACHDAEQPIASTVSSVPLADVWRKTTVEQMAAFLRDPLKTRHGGRMPNMRLSEDEAVNVAAYLLRRQAEGDGAALPAVMNPPGEPFAVDPKMVPIGKRMFVNLGCADCHHLDGYRSKVYAPTFARQDLDARIGCLDWNLPRSLPQYRLADWQRDAMKAALEAREEWTKPADAKVEAMVQLARMNCLACHSRDEALGGIADAARAAYFTSSLPESAGAEAKLPPTLTTVGLRLTPTQMADLMIHGRGHQRPWLHTRMPTIGEKNAAGFIELLRAADQLPQP